LVFVHGNGVDHRIDMPLGSVVDAVGEWERWHLDLPGFGASPLPDSIVSTQTMAEALLSWLRDTFGDSRFALVGSSYGGLLARYVVSQIPQQIDGLALLYPLAVADRKARTLPLRRVARYDPAVEATASPSDWAEYAEVAVVESARGWNAYQEFVLAPPGTSGIPPIVARLESSYDLAVPPERAERPFVRPSLILCGRDDHIVGYQDQWDLMPHYPAATYAALTDAGHALWFDQPELVSAHFADWLMRLRASFVG